MYKILIHLLTCSMLYMFFSSLTCAKGQVLCDSTYMRELVKIVETQSRSLYCQGLERRGNGRQGFMPTESQLYKVKRATEMNDGDG